MSAGLERKLGHHVPEEFPAPIRGLAAVSRFVAVLEGVGIGISLVALIGLALWQFVTRNLRMHGVTWIPQNPEWLDIDNVLRHAVFLIGFLGAMFASYTGRHLRVDAVTRLAGPRARMALRSLATMGALTVCAFIIYASWTYRATVLEETPEKGQIFTAARGALVIVVGTAGMALHFLIQLVLDVVYLVTGEEPPAWWIAEASHGGDAAADSEVSSTSDVPEAAP
jgi:TRAP-type C4-dicarboxylate transport system permease small subunit